MWFRGATVWFALTAGLAAVATLFALSAPDLAGVDPIWLGLLVAGFGGCAFISHRASKGHTRAIVIALVLGMIGVGLPLAVAIDRLLPWNGALYGISADAFRGIWPSAAIVVPPASLLVVGGVRYWCAAGGDSRPTRVLRARILTALIALPIIVLALVSFIAPLCPGGRTCVHAAGISLVLPAGWSRPIAGEGLFEAGAGDTRRMVIEDGQELIGSATSLDAVEEAAVDLLSTGIFLGYSHSDVRSERIQLPVGPAVRVAYHSTPWFFQVDQYNVTEWFFIDGRLLVIEYQEVPPGSARDDFQAVRDSLLPLSE